jgi:hypothetical protein
VRVLQRAVLAGGPAVHQENQSGAPQVAFACRPFDLSAPFHRRMAPKAMPHALYALAGRTLGIFLAGGRALALAWPTVCGFVSREPWGILLAHSNFCLFQTFPKPMAVI